MFIDDIRVFALQFRCISFSHCLCEANFLADSPTSLGDNLNNQQIWVGVVPLSWAGNLHHLNLAIGRVCRFQVVGFFFLVCEQKEKIKKNFEI